MADTGAPVVSDMFDQLVWVHDHLRRELDGVRQLAAAVTGGAGGEEIAAALAGLQQDSLLWQLRLGCMRYCRVVHMHHHLEDVALFPSLQREDDTLAPVVAKLMADHRVVSELLDAVEETGGALSGDDTEGLRNVLVERLERLAEVLLAHLAYEEENIGPALRAMTSLPWG